MSQLAHAGYGVGDSLQLLEAHRQRRRASLSRL